MRFIDRDEVARRLTYDVCIPIVRQAMVAFSKGETKQLLRSIIPLSEGRLFGVMPGAMGAHGPFGAKVISVFNENAALGRQSHQGLVLLFDPAPERRFASSTPARSRPSARPRRAPSPPTPWRARTRGAWLSSAPASRP